MKFRFAPMAVVIAAVALPGAMALRGQAQPAAQTSEQAFHNVQLLKGIPVNQFMATMGFFSASLGENCTFCHVADSSGNWAKYADDNPNKRTARSMIVMVSAINKMYFGGRREVTCYSCHRGGDRPRVTPSLVDLYGPPHPEEPDQISSEGPGKPTPEQVLDRYIAALGGAQKLATVTSFAAKGTYQGFSDLDGNPYEVFAKAPNQRTTIVHTGNGTSTAVYDGRAGWTAAPGTDSPVAVLALTGGDLEGARLDAELSFPARIKDALKQWRVGYPATIDGRHMELLQGTTDGKYPVNLYFDSKSGLLARMVRYTDSPVGLAPTQVDYNDYRDIAGIKMPFRWTVTWLDGRAKIQLTSLDVNARIDPAKFARPAPSVPPQAAK